MPNHNWHLDMEFLQRGVKHLCLHLNGYVMMIRPVTVAVTGTIEGKRAIARRYWTVESRPVLTRARITMNQDDRTTGAFDYEMQTRAVDSHEFRVRLRIVVSDARSDVALLKSSGYFHDWCNSLGASADVSGSHKRLTTETERPEFHRGKSSFGQGRPR